jgi:hypothetical protein
VKSKPWLDEDSIAVENLMEILSQEFRKAWKSMNFLLDKSTADYNQTHFTTHLKAPSRSLSKLGVTNWFSSQLFSSSTPTNPYLQFNLQELSKQWAKKSRARVYWVKAFWGFTTQEKLRRKLFTRFKNLLFNFVKLSGNIMRNMYFMFLGDSDSQPFTARDNFKH